MLYAAVACSLPSPSSSPPPAANCPVHAARRMPPAARHHALPLPYCMSESDCNSCCHRALLSLPPLIDMWGQSLDAHRAAQEARRIEARAASTIVLESRNSPSPNKTPRKKTRSIGYGTTARPFSLDISALQENYGGQLIPPPQLAGGPPMLLQRWLPPQWDEHPCLDSFATAAIDTANKATPDCDWAQIGKWLVCSTGGPLLIQCALEGCVRCLHHMCQAEWESKDVRREAHGSRKMCTYHHPALADMPVQLPPRTC